MYPGSFIWSWLSDDWLLSKKAHASFALSAALIVGMTVAICFDLPDQNRSLLEDILWGALGVAAAVSAFYLWGGMWRHWIRQEQSRGISSRTWRIVLTVGVFYGAVLYYVLEYIPSQKLNPVD
jgi:hypothetical protein